MLLIREQVHLRLPSVATITTWKWLKTIINTRCFSVCMTIKFKLSLGGNWLNEIKDKPLTLEGFIAYMSFLGTYSLLSFFILFLFCFLMCWTYFRCNLYSSLESKFHELFLFPPPFSILDVGVWLLLLSSRLMIQTSCMSHGIYAVFISTTWDSVPW